MLPSLKALLCSILLLPSGFFYQAPQPGLLKVSSTPTGASITINGQLMNGKTNATFVVTPGEYKIEVTSDSKKLTCNPESTHVYSGQTTQVSCS